MRTIVVGDVHGCRRELETLLAEVSYAPDSDALVLVGDLVAKGPDSAGVVALCRRYGARTVRGNHDEHCLRWRRAIEDDAALPELKPAHREVCESLNEDDWRYLELTPLWLRLTLPERDVLVVHAGIDPRRKLTEQEPSNLMNMRSILPDGSVSKRIVAAPWAASWAGPELILFGHDAIRGLQRHAHALGLDSGCVYGGALSAAILDDESTNVQVVSVPAERTWCPPVARRVDT